jgi:2-hydroxy-3-keto-5-methylthiopentenyl-1-phosphate phosphatase
MKEQSFKGIISSDWNQCLAPCGPFDPMTYSYPDLTSDLTTIFKEYTGNKISLGTANKKIERLLPEPMSIQQMDAYLEDSFITYKGVPDLIDWCLKNKILFMINTTGVMGYFQRIFAKKLLPKVPVISANAMIRYPALETDPPHMYELHEIQDKGKNTEAALKSFGISEKKMVIIGDSGGDGPHFEWGEKHGAYMIGSMAKPSLTNYCIEKNIEINLLFGPAYEIGEERNGETEMLVDFMELRSVFESILA